MGYMGLDHWVDSDLAAAAQGNMIAAMVKSLKKSLKERGNSYNTEGPVNVALIFETYIIPVIEEYCECSDMFELAAEVINGLEDTIKEAKKCGSDAEHMAAYRRMLKAMKKFVRKSTIAYD